MADGSRPESIPTTATDVPSTANSSVRASAERGHARPRCARRRPAAAAAGPSTSRRPGTRTAANPSSTTSGVERVAEERLHRRQRDGGVGALVGAVQRDEHVLVAAARGPQRDQPAADGDPVRLAAEVPAGHPHRGRPDRSGPGLDDVDQVGGHLPHDDPAARLDDPGLVGGDALERRAEHVGVVEADVGQHGDVAVHDVGAVPRAAQPDLDHHGVDRLGRRTTTARPPSGARSGSGGRPPAARAAPAR